MPTSPPGGPPASDPNPGLGDEPTGEARPERPAAFAYDPDGVRVDVDGRAQLWDRSGWLPMLVDDGQAHTWSPGGLLAAGDQWALNDALGSVRATSSPSGDLLDSVDYRAFGEPSTAWEGVGYTGGIHDPTGLIHLRARHHDPVLGRFTTRDPIQPGAPGTCGYNHYTYVANNPTTWTDPTGQGALSDYATSLSVAAAGAQMWIASGSPGSQCAMGALQGLVEGIFTAGNSIRGVAQDAVLGCILDRVENLGSRRGGGRGGSGGTDRSQSDSTQRALPAGPGTGGTLRITGGGFSASERRVAQDLYERGHDVVLRQATGVERTSDLILDGVPYDVYTPTTGNVDRIVSNIASKGSQVRGGGVVIDLRSSPLSSSDLGDLLPRVQGVSSQISDIIVIE